DPEWTRLTVALRDLDPLHWRWPILLRLEPCAHLLDPCFQIALKLLRRLPLHSPRAPAIPLLPPLDPKLTPEQMCQRREAELGVHLGLLRDPRQSCAHPLSASGCRDVSPTRVLLCSAPSPCARLSRAPSTTHGSDSPRSVCSRMVGPFRRHTRRR